MERPTGWRGIFGQGGKADSHLRKNGVGADDLFLFFGWFRRTVWQNGHLIFDPNARKGVYLIYGYLQVDYKISFTENRDNARAWMNYHPHLRLKAWNDRNNAIYLARKTLTWDKSKLSAAVFRFHDRLVLTNTTFQNNPERNRTFWRAALFPEGLFMTYHNAKSHKTEITPDGSTRYYFKAACRGQEFVIKDSSRIVDWVKPLINLARVII
ncbi:MAG: hypothetical protein K9W42_06540 [Candidatus Heimdallarchaeota archaeon]|nr:hypothetical protein [Candidatus Heimdallarchaeota archaeon]